MVECGTEEELRNRTGLSRATIWRIRTSRENRFHPATAGKLLKAINGEERRDAH